MILVALTDSAFISGCLILGGALLFGLGVIALNIGNR